MYRQNNLRKAALVFSAVLMFGCANNESKPASDADGATPTAAADSRQSGAERPAAAQPSVSVPNPTVISFEKMSIVLDGNARETIALAAERARVSAKVLVTGYCDRRQIRNATDSAVARAVAVRDELIAHGIQPAIIRIKFETARPKKHAAEIKFE